MQANGLYIHIPFCDKICTYCDFAKVYSDVMNHTDYIKALQQEYELYKAQGLNPSFQTIYFGGGTPSALNADNLHQLLSLFCTEIIGAREITFEANPDSLTIEKIQILQEFGVNRVSLGVQTFNEKALKYLGRTHTVTQIKTAVKNLHTAGINNYNLDLIYALPQQTLADLDADLTQVLALQPTHISAYALIVEEHTKLFLDIENQQATEVEEDMQVTMYQHIQNKLQTAGYQQYEVSNWSKPHKEAIHNSNYWRLLPYLGLGLGSHGYIDNRRYSNTRSIQNYMRLLSQQQQLPVVETTLLTEEQQMEEMMFLGLRLRTGVSKIAFFQKNRRTIEAVYGTVIAKHIEKGNLINDGDYLRLTNQAIFISNEVLSDFIINKE